MRCTKIKADGTQCRATAKTGYEHCAAHLGTAGRKTLLTLERIQVFDQTLRSGGFFNYACARAGVAEATGYSWKERGESDREAGIESLYAKFVETVERAENDALTAAMAEIRRAGQEGNWKASAWYVERKDPRTRLSRDSRNQAIEPKAPPRELSWGVDKLDASELEQLARLMDKAEGADDAGA